jgi:hypothetical protein
VGVLREKMSVGGVRSCSGSLELIKRGLMEADVFMAVSALCNLVLPYSFFGPCHSNYLHTWYDLFNSLFHSVR